MKHALALIACFAAVPAAADVADAVNDLILPGYAEFAGTAAALRDAAAADCAPDAVRPLWNATFDAWMNVSHLSFGPVETDGRAVIVAFWPDERGAGQRTLATLIADADPVIATEGGTARLSAAARGLFGLEYLLYDPAFAGAGDYGCALIRALSADLAQVSGDVLDDWQGGYAETLRTAGAPGNPTYLTAREGTQILFTALMTGLDFTADERLGRPLGTFDRPRPTRAEAWRSARSARNVALSLRALSDLARALATDDTPATDAAFARALTLAEALDDPALAGVADPEGRLRVEILQQAIRAIPPAVLVEIGDVLGISAGFNSADGD